MGHAPSPAHLGPHLGMATTAELLDELNARMTITAPMATEAEKGAAGIVAVAVAQIARTLSPATLAYRTVDQ